MAEESMLQYIPIKKLVPCPLNPRKDLGNLTDLKNSIIAKGIIQPLLVRPAKNDKFEIVAGERRYTAALDAIKAGKLPKDFNAPAICKDLDDNQVMQMMLIENIIRDPLNDYEQAKGFKDYLAKFIDQTAIESLAEQTGLSVTFIRRRAKVMDLPENVLQLWNEGNLAYGHLEQLLRVPAELLSEVIDEIMANDMTIAELSNFIEYNQCSLSQASFNTKECGKCQHSTKVQGALFGDDFKASKNLCNNPSCYRDKQIQFFNENWKELDVVKKYETNGIVISNRYNETNSINGDVVESCKVCEHYVSQIHANGNVCYNQACKGDAACYKRNYLTSRSTTGAPLPMTEEQVKQEKVEKRNENIGRECAEIFYKEKLARMLLLDYFSIENLRALLLAMVNTNREFLILGIDKIKQWQEHNAAIRDLKNRIPSMTPDEIMEYLANMTGAILLSAHTPLNDRIAAAKSFGLYLENEFVMTEDYLKKKSRDQLIDLNEQFKILPDYGRTGLSAFKKTEIIRRFLEKDLTGMIPDEIKAVVAEKVESIESSSDISENTSESDMAVNE